MSHVTWNEIKTCTLPDFVSKILLWFLHWRTYLTARCSDRQRILRSSQVVNDDLDKYTCCVSQCTVYAHDDSAVLMFPNTCRWDDDVHTNLFLWPISHMFSTNNSTASFWPQWDAAWSGVHPSLSISSTFAPACIIILRNAIIWKRYNLVVILAFWNQVLILNSRNYVPAIFCVIYK